MFWMPYGRVGKAFRNYVLFVLESDGKQLLCENQILHNL